MARNTRYDAAWAFATAPDTFNKQAALDLVSANLEELLGLNDGVGLVEGERGWVAYEGDALGFAGRVRAVRGEGAEMVDLF